MARKIMYCAFPTRMLKGENNFTSQAKQVARSAGYSPVVPFDALSYEDSEAGPLSRERTLKFDIDLMRCCDTLGVFGIAPGVMGEIRDAMYHGLEVRVFYGYDPKWENEYETLKDYHGDLLAELRGPYRLIALVGQSAVGKNFWSERLIENFGSYLKGVKNTTTRDRRPGKEKEDELTYNFVSREEFEDGIAKGRFLEHDEYLGNYYGSSMDSIRSVLSSTNGIFAVTPSGAVALHGRRFEINLTIVLLKPASGVVLKRNLELRGITDPAEQQKLLEQGDKFHLPPEISHKVVEITGDTFTDRNNLLSAISSLQKPR